MAGHAMSTVALLALCLMTAPDATLASGSHHMPAGLDARHHARQATHALMARGLFTPVKPATTTTSKASLFSPKNLFSPKKPTVAAAPSSPVVGAYFDDWWAGQRIPSAASSLTRRLSPGPAQISTHTHTTAVLLNKAISWGSPLRILDTSRL